MADHLIEVRGEMPRELIDVIDAVVQATPGASRMSELREIVGAWVDQKVHEASLIQRVRRSNGNEPESGRSRGGRGSA